MRKDGLNEQEGKVMDNLINAWNEYIKLDNNIHLILMNFAMEYINVNML